MVGLAEESEELGIYTVDDLPEVFGLVLEVESVGVDSEHSSVVVLKDEVVVSEVEPFEIVELHLLFVVSASELYLSHQLGHRLTQIDHQVRFAHERHHQMEELHIGLIVVVGEVALLIVVLDEHIDALEDRAVLNDGVVSM